MIKMTGNGDSSLALRSTAVSDGGVAVAPGGEEIINVSVSASGEDRFCENASGVDNRQVKLIRYKIFITSSLVIQFFYYLRAWRLPHAVNIAYF